MMSAVIMAMMALLLSGAHAQCGGPVRGDAQCGSSVNGASCPIGQCCSSAGWCGSGSAYCDSPQCPAVSTQQTRRPRTRRPPARTPTSNTITNGDVSSFNWCGPSKTIALTFDDSFFIEPAFTNLMNDLARLQITATFFMVPQNLPQTKTCSYIQRVLDGGHTFQHHSYDHSDFLTLTSSQVEDQIVAVPAWVQRQCKITLPMTQFRPPFGNFNHDLALQVNRLGYTIALWTVDSQDWNGYSLEQSKASTASLYSDLFGGSAILLHHDSHYTPDSAQGILDWYVQVQFPGYKFVSMDQCFKLCVAAKNCQAPGDIWPGVFGA